MLADIDGALKDGGHFIVFEPILTQGEEQVARSHSNPDQHMAVRSVEEYDKFFKVEGWKKIHRKKYPKDGVNDEDLVGYVFQKNY